MDDNIKKNDILEKLVEKIDKDIIIEDIFMYSYGVFVKSINTGFSSFIRNESSESWNEIRYNNLPGMNAHKAAYLLLKSNSYEARSVLTALISSCCDNNSKDIVNGKLPDIYIDDLKNKYTIFIGHFPIADKLKKQGYKVDIVELNPKDGDIHFKDSTPFLKKADHIFITGFTIVNNTLPEILNNSSQAKHHLFGPTVPFTKDLFDLGIDTIASTLFKDVEKVKEYYSRGGRGMKNIDKQFFSYVYIKKVI